MIRRLWQRAKGELVGVAAFLLVAVSVLAWSVWVVISGVLWLALLALGAGIVVGLVWLLVQRWG